MEGVFISLARAQLSPIVDNVAGGYHGYWASNFYKLNPHFGTDDEFRSLISTAHSKNIAVMVDVVVNNGLLPCFACVLFF